MRLQLFNESISGAFNSYDLVHRLEALLVLWRQPVPWEGLDRGDSPFESHAEAQLWASFVERAQPAEPVTSRNGLEAAIRRWNKISANNTPPQTLGVMEANGLVRVDGPRAGTRNSLGPGAPLVPMDGSWHLSLSCDEAEAKPLMEICERTFVAVNYSCGELYVGDARPLTIHGASVVARLAVGVTEPSKLAALWRKAAALEVAVSWIGMLDRDQKSRLADQLTQELLAAAAQLSWRTDYEFDSFAAGQFATPDPSQFSTRLDEAFSAARMQQQSYVSLAPDFVFGQMASGVILAGDAAQIGRLLCGLPPGRAYFAAVHTLRTLRPQVIAYLLAHVAFSPEAMFAMSDWPDTLSVQGNGLMAMREEWAEVTKISRRLVLFHDRGPHYPSLLAWISHDEAHNKESWTALSRFVPAPPPEAWLEPLSDRLAVADHVELAVAACEQRLRGAPETPDFVVALRLLALLPSIHVAQIARLAIAIVDAYEACFLLSGGERKGVPRLTGYGDLLSVLDNAVRVHDAAARKRWLIPFDADKYARMSHDEVQFPITGNSITPSFDCPRYVHAHATHLAAAASATSVSDSIVLAETFVRLFERTHGKMKHDAWNWEQQTGNDPEPQMVRFAGVLLRLSGAAAKDLLDRLVDSKATALHLAELLWGLNGRSTLAEHITPRARRYAQNHLNAADMSLGYANPLAVALYYAGESALAEQCARYVLNSIRSDTNSSIGDIRDTSIKVLFASWLAQKKWRDIETTDLVIDEPGGQTLVENLRAIAELESGKYDESLARLNRLLKRVPKDAMALTNVAAVYAERGDWVACQTACNQARNLLESATPPQVSANEAKASFHLRDFRGTAAALERLPAEVARTPEMIKLRVSVAMTTAPMISQLDDDLRELSKTDADTADLLRARLAALSEMEIAGGGFTSNILPRRFRSFEERCADRLKEPETLIIEAIGSAAQRIAEQPALARELNEDQLTRLLCVLLIVLEPLRVYAHPLGPSGWGPKKEGISDFWLSEMPEHSHTHGRRIVRGEAKFWKGSKWATKGMEQIFATSNTGQELLLALVIYSNMSNFETAVEGTRRTLARFGSKVTNEFATLGQPEEVSLKYGKAVRVFKTCHGVANGHVPTRTLYTIVIDVRSEASRKIRQGADRQQGAAKKRTRTVGRMQTSRKS